jgi:hypothetical protein
MMSLMGLARALATKETRSAEYRMLMLPLTVMMMMVLLLESANGQKRTMLAK